MSIQITDLRGNDKLWPFASTNGTVKKLEEAFRSSLGSSGRLSDHKASLAASKRFTEQGIAAEAHRFAKNELLPGIARGHVALQQAKRQVKDRLGQMKPKAADKSDVVGWLNRQAVRDSLLALSREERESYLSRYAGELDPEILLAAIEHQVLPWQTQEQKFISDETRAALTRQLLATEHGETLAEIDQIEQAIAYVAPTIEKARNEIQSNLGLDAMQFAEAARAEASKNPPPIWLKRVGDRVVAMTLSSDGENVDTTAVHTATAAELEAGAFYDDIGQFIAAHRVAA